MPTQEEIYALMRRNGNTEADILFVKKAHDFVANAHKDHKRYSGEPYIHHLEATARNLAELGMDARTIAAGLLHDSIEDVGTTDAEIEKEFGPEVLFLVDGVTKLGHLRFKGAMRHNESLRKLMVATSKDLRVLIIKLADRLHNMQTLHFVPAEKQVRIATETLEIYAPIAYRLGIRKINRELEDLAFKYVYPKQYNEARDLLKVKNAEYLKHLEKFHRSIVKNLTAEGIIGIRTDSRVKGLYSLYKKYIRKGQDVEKIYDILAIRIMVPTEADCYKALGIIHSIWRPLPGRIKDYISFPKANGYRSLHTTIFTGHGGIIEIQIKTEEMFKESEYGVASHLGYKLQTNSKSQEENWGFAWIKSLLPKRIFRKNGSQKIEEQNIDIKEAGMPAWIKDLVKYQESEEDTEEYVKEIKADFFTQRIFVFTPKGDVVDLPIDSTPIDFAYSIHSDIGNHVSGAKINGKFMAIDTKLKHGDIVEIIVKQTSKPSIKWIDYAKTTLAKRHVRSKLEELGEKF